MPKILPITQAREDLTNIVDRAKRLLEEYVITVNGVPAAVILSAAEYESWKETNEILADKELMHEIREAEKELKEGKGISWEKVKKDLRLNV
ncbi:MAG: type II toxin-antitoxin system Phd/YefM family antitoxin [Patescibacteria group bacterium]